MQSIESWIVRVKAIEAYLRRLLEQRRDCGEERRKGSVSVSWVYKQLSILNNSIWEERVAWISRAREWEKFLFFSRVGTTRMVSVSNTSRLNMFWTVRILEGENEENEESSSEGREKEQNWAGVYASIISY